MSQQPERRPSVGSAAPGPTNPLVQAHERGSIASLFGVAKSAMTFKSATATQRTPVPSTPVRGGTGDPGGAAAPVTPVPQSAGRPSTTPSAAATPATAAVATGAGTPAVNVDEVETLLAVPHGELRRRTTPGLSANTAESPRLSPAGQRFKAAAQAVTAVHRLSFMATLRRLWMLALKRTLMVEDFDVAMVFRGEAKDASMREYARRRLVDVGLSVDVSNSKDGSEVFFKLRAAYGVLITTAESMQLKKAIVSDAFRVAPLGSVPITQFRGYEKPETFFNSLDRQRIVMHLVESIEGRKGDTFVCNGVGITAGESLVAKLKTAGVIVRLFGLHDDQTRDHLLKTWAGSFRVQPLDKIKDYFGHEIAFYFAWLGFYTGWLIAPVLMGLFVFWGQMAGGSADNPHVLVYSVFISVWATIFLEYWKRHSSVLSFKWDVMDFEESEIDRPAFKGSMRQSPVTGELEKYYPRGRRFLKYIGSGTCMAVMLAAALALMLSKFKLQEYVEQHYGGMLANGVTIAYALMIPHINRLCCAVATRLNDWENHRTDSDHQAGLVLKRVVLELPNYYSSLFYAAFVLQDMDLLRSQLATLLVTMQIVGNIKEVVIPRLCEMYAIHKAGGEGRPIPQIECENTLEEYESTFEDYLEMIVQFGYVTLFAAAFPLAPLCAFVNNVIEIRSDAFKLCANSQRPFGRDAGGIGIWLHVLSFMSKAAVITNAAVVAFTSRQALSSFEFTPFTRLIIIVTAEHLVVWLKNVFEIAIPDLPEWVENMIARRKYLDRKAAEEARRSHEDTESRASEHVRGLAQMPTQQGQAGVGGTPPLAREPSHRGDDTPTRHLVRSNANSSESSPQAQRKADLLAAPALLGTPGHNGRRRMSNVAVAASSAAAAQAAAASSSSASSASPVIVTSPPVIYESDLPEFLHDFFPHIAAGMGAAFALGALGFHFMWLPWAYFCIAAIENRQRKWVARRAELNACRRLHPNVALPSSRPAGLPDDADTARWLNGLIRKVWITYGGDAAKVIVATVEPMLEQYRPSFVSSIRLERFDLGRKPPEFNGFRLHPGAEDDEAVLDVDFKFETELEAVLGIHVGVVNCPIALREVEVSGRLRVRVKLVREPPFISTLGIAFYEAPKIDFVIKPLKAVDLMEMPGVAGFLDHFLNVTLAGMMVLPAELVVPLTNEAPEPKLLRITLVRGTNLAVRDIGGTSDPYVVMRVGDKKFRSAVVERSLNPVWNQQFECRVDNAQGARLELEVWDEDMVKDESMGRCTVQLSGLQEGFRRSLWLDLENVECGQINVVLALLPLDGQEAMPGTLHAVVREVRGLHVPDRCESVVCAVRVGSGKVWTEDMRTNPRDPLDLCWNERLSLPVRYPKRERLVIGVCDEDAPGTPIATCEVILDDLVEVGSRDYWAALVPADAKGKGPVGGESPMARLELSFVAEEGGGGVVLQEPERHVVQMVLVEARGLQSPRAVSKYVSVRLGNDRWTSRQAKGTNSAGMPVWNDTRDFVADDLLTQRLTMTLVEDGLLKDKDLGKCAVPLASLVKGRLNDLWVPLDEPGVGEIRLQISLLKV